MSNTQNFLTAYLNPMTRDGNVLLDSGRLMLESVPRFHAVDGFNVSMQASAYHYSIPKNDVGPYTAVELGFPSHAEERLRPFAEEEHDLTQTVYGWVPLEIIANIIDTHGGPSEEMYTLLNRRQADHHLELFPFLTSKQTSIFNPMPPSQLPSLPTPLPEELEEAGYEFFMSPTSAPEHRCVVYRHDEEIGRCSGRHEVIGLIAKVEREKIEAQALIDMKRTTPKRKLNL